MIITTRFRCVLAVPLVLLGIAASSSAEVSGDRQHLTAEFNDTTLETALTEIADATGIEIITSQALDKSLSIAYTDISAEKLLKRLLHSYNAMYLKDPISGQLKTVRIFAGSNAKPAIASAPKQATGNEAIEANGRYYMTVLLNGTAVHLLVDTGANTLALSQPVADKLALMQGQSTNVNTAGGKSTASRTVVDSVVMAGKELRGVQAVILPNLQENGLIGQNVLAHFKRVTANGKMVFEPLGAANNDKQGQAQQTQTQGQGQNNPKPVPQARTATP